MDNKEINVNELIKIEQLPKIYQQLDQINEIVLEKVKGLNEIQCTEENKQEAKNYKAYLNKIKTELENRRKEIKKQISEPYDKFNAYYEEKVKSVLDNGINQLTEKISEIEKQQIEEKRQEVENFFEEYRTFYHLESIIESIDNVPIKINLSNSLKSLKEETQAFLIKISEEIKVINKEPTNREEILLEYKNNGFDYARAKLAVQQKQEELEKIKKANELAEQEFKQEQNVIQEVETLLAEPVEVEEEEILEIIFKVKTTRTKLKELKNYLISNGIDYE
jgi:hypothetical protein